MNRGFCIASVPHLINFMQNQQEKIKMREKKSLTQRKRRIPHILLFLHPRDFACDSFAFHLRVDLQMRVDAWIDVEVRVPHAASADSLRLGGTPSVSDGRGLGRGIDHRINVEEGIIHDALDLLCLIGIDRRIKIKIGVIHYAPD